MVTEILFVSGTVLTTAAQVARLVRFLR